MGKVAPTRFEKEKKLKLITAETPFYGESGGQIGDIGTLETARGDVVAILDAQKPQPSLIVHRGRVVRGAVQVGDRVRLVIDAPRRNATRLKSFCHPYLACSVTRGVGTARYARRDRS